MTRRRVSDPRPVKIPTTALSQHSFSSLPIKITRRQIPEVTITQVDRIDSTLHHMATAIDQSAWMAMSSQTPSLAPDVPPPSYNVATQDRSQGSRAETLAVNAPEAAKLPTGSVSMARPANPLPGMSKVVASAKASTPRSLFPTVFNFYFGHSSLSTFWIGEHRETPLYAYCLHSGFSGLPPVVLHSSPEVRDDNMWADIDWSMFQNEIRIGLPDLPEKGERVTEMLQRDQGRQMTSVFRFSIEAGSAGSCQREEYEWRRSSGDAIESLGGDGDGYKLMRLAEDAPPGADRAQCAKSMSGFVSSDGFEVVAAWSGVSGSLTKHGKFRFMGTGASGLLGERWVLMAVVTSLALWERERRSRKHRSGAIGSMGVAVAAVILSTVRMWGGTESSRARLSSCSPPLLSCISRIIYKLRSQVYRIIRIISNGIISTR